jgi:hypothetical protein
MNGFEKILLIILVLCGAVAFAMLFYSSAAINLPYEEYLRRAIIRDGIVFIHKLSD